MKLDFPDSSDKIKCANDLELKKFQLSLILEKIRINHEIAIGMTSSGIAAMLFDEGRTAHSALKLSLNLNITAHPICNIGKTSRIAIVLKTLQLII